MKTVSAEPSASRSAGSARATMGPRHVQVIGMQDVGLIRGCERGPRAEHHVAMQVVGVVHATLADTPARSKLRDQDA